MLMVITMIPSIPISAEEGIIAHSDGLMMNDNQGDGVIVTKNGKFTMPAKDVVSTGSFETAATTQAILLSTRSSQLLQGLQAAIYSISESTALQAAATNMLRLFR